MKFKVGETVKIKSTGEKVKIERATLIDEEYFLYYLFGYEFPLFECELKTYRPSRAGKRDTLTGRFIKNRKEIHIPEGNPFAPEKIEKVDDSSFYVWRNKQEIDGTEIINQLIDANSALEERVKKLEKERPRFPDMVGIPDCLPASLFSPIIKKINEIVERLNNMQIHFQ